MSITQQENKNFYSDGEIEDRLIEVLSQGGDVFEIPYKGGAVFHNFTDARENLINWYPFREHSSVLEIGARMGALTGILCDRCEHVTALEQSPKRAEIIRLRNKDRANLEVMCGDIYGQDFTRKFDYILLIGVLEYVGINCKDENPYKKILDKIGGLLKPEGVLLLAIENQFGLKYWCGAAEDHTGIPFDGIAGYASNGYTTRYDSEGVRTFSRSALCELLQNSGLLHQRWYYPLPDYKFPMAVFSDEYLPQNSDIDSIKFTYPVESELIADEKQIYKELIANGVFPFFANSFLIEASAGGLSERFIKYASLKRDYAREYRVSTLIDSEDRVIKRCIGKESAPHLKRYARNMKELTARNIPLVDTWEEQDDVVQAWQNLPRTDTVFKEYLLNGEWDAAVHLLDELATDIRRSSDTYMANTCNIAGLAELTFRDREEILLDGYLDMSFVNSFLDHGTIRFFDQEWKHPDVPVKYILYRAIKYAYVQNDRFPLESLYQYVGIDSHMSERFDDAEVRMLESLMDKEKCAVFDPNMYHEGLTLQYKFQSDRGLREKAEQEIQGLKSDIATLSREKGELSKENEALKVTNAMELETNSKLKSELKSLADENIRLKDGENRYQQQLQTCRQQLQENAQTIRNKEGHIELLLETEREYEREKKSRTYRMALVFRKISVFFLPPNSKRRFMAKMLVRGIRHPRLMLHMINPRRIRNFFVIAKKEGMDSVNEHYRLVEEYETSMLYPFQTDRLEVSEVSETPDKTLEDYGRLSFPRSENPAVSVVIPVYNQFEYTYNCLESILKNSGDIPYEIIVADDRSTDLTKDLEKIAEGITVLHNRENLRFLLNCNNAAKQAKGKYILFLNNDTQVQPGWLAPLVSLIERDEKIGMVGSRLVYPDGRLQEAGGIIWGDGHAWNYGNGQNPEQPEFNYVKETDYISGAAIMIRADLWRKIGGFDERFVPSYCEDSDLAFEVRRHGYKVLYQPLSVVVHFEGRSNGTDIHSGLKQYQVINSEKLREKWADEFAEQSQTESDLFHARDRSQNKKTILVIDHYVPMFDKDAGSRTIWQYINMFINKGYNVKFMGDNFYPHEPYTTALQQIGVEVLYGPWYAQNYRQWILDNKENIDFAFLNRPHITEKYIDLLKDETDIKCIYYGCDLHCMRIRREYELCHDPKLLAEAQDWEKREFAIMRKTDVNYYPSCVEIEQIRKTDPSIPAKTFDIYVYNEFRENIPSDFSKREGILFVGGFGHPPNEDAVLWFAEQIFPEIRRQCDIPFYVVGANPTERVKKLEGNGIRVKGFVTDDELAELYDTCRMAVIPLRYGAGVKGKVIEALYYGIPMITTSVGIEGITGAEQFVEIADTAELFARKTIALYNDTEELSRTVRIYQNYVKEHCSVEAVWNHIKDDFTR